ncbi:MULTISPECIES: dihydroneopterin aldolase [Prochlorococcus]|uniref:Dihydroneopterin aldolase n=1 Tax=Prochlorococcus marinus (strain SARG / CCMP1375 / SS120) TaxID=167539 RepID=Q7VBM2_PROMA|nr:MULTISPECIES: dihydroneopterin aldolase [Prochlorococcus]AAQ00115.1 Dihydroneopterin aldolase [Prochlorococcus marinus subsp. marinus str. CCMP1375]KGG13911.1 Dihydroneopterin aldolase [Prochlorococcus marinus str. LG]KGG19044.1 Dihydroneopterin aldolase [Prochlorococcus marinus str. SS2]KGG23416.1 Dihydroneopterin aldolase [Prochlorococcus marinus str. SS35]KGG32348.1 Dihydroneopterin aldolase [Prochlorococcus marinus str. SS51]
MKPPTFSSIHVEGINLWAHVGVLEKERLLGQLFLLDFTLWLDLETACKSDDLSLSADYSLAIKSLQQLSFQIRCKTIEYFSEQILDRLEMLYGTVPIRISLEKCYPPIDGFTGSVSIQRNRNNPPFK